ncbi:MAG: S41 family peptidase [Planctomycetota bacterium]
MCSPAVAVGQQELTSAQMREDLEQLTEALQARHPGLHRYATQEEIAAAVAAAHQAIAEPLETLAFFRVIAPLLATVRCGHTTARPGNGYVQSLMQHAKLLPCDVALLGDRTFVTSWHEPASSQPNGCELLSLDGVALSELRERLLPSMRGDGYIPTARLRELEQQFSLYYALLVDTKPEGEFQVEIRAPGQSTTTTSVAGKRFSPPRGGLDGAPIEFAVLPDEVGLLTVRTFSSGAMERQDIDYRAFLRATFEQLRQDEIGHLIVDLRGNTGGTDQMGALLVSYLCPEAFGYFERIEVTASYSGEGGIESDAAGRRLVTEHPGTQPQEPADVPFGGKLALLVDGRTFSTAADVATVVHHKQRAIFFGEEVGGGYDGNSSGVMHTETLAHSGIMVRIPLWMYTTANLGHERRGRGVPVDYELQPTIDDVIAGRDPVLAKAVAELRDSE